jgi:hypothetical protein
MACAAFPSNRAARAAIRSGKQEDLKMWTFGTRVNTEEQVINWGAACEQDQIDALTSSVLAEDFARALDKLGWMIVQNREFKDKDEPVSKWPMDPRYGPVPAWADDTSNWHSKKQ